METESLAKIAIRGKGSVKEGKGKSDAAHASNQDEDLHCLIMADTEEKVNKAKKLIWNVIETVCTGQKSCTVNITDTSQAASIPEGQNELKRNQLRELAALNGTLRDDENQACQNCGEIGHRKYDCPQAKNFTANIICRVCGNAGHMARDCTERARGQDWRSNNGAQPRIGDAMDNDYEKLMNELGGGGEEQNPARQIGWEGAQGEANGDAPQGNVRPWQRGPTGGPAPWQQNRQPPSNPAPWNNPDRRGYGGGYNAQPPPPPPNNPAPWQQQQQQQQQPSRGQAAPWAQNGNMGGGGYGGGAPPWQQQQQPMYHEVPPPPPPSDIPPPPPPSDVPPPAPPPPPQ